MYARYQDFYLHVGWPDERGRFPIQVVQSPCGETRQPIWQENRLRLPGCQHILDYLQELVAEPEEVELLGKSLHEFLFPAEVGEILHRCREDKTQGVRIRLRIDPEELSLLPWEYCFDSRTRQYLALERQTPIVRYIAENFASPTTLSMPQPVKLLVVLAAPRDLPQLDMQREEAGIRQALRNVPVDLTVLRHATIEKLHDVLLDVEPHILHFSGHGVVNGGVGALALERSGSADTDPLTARQLRGLLNRMGITLAVLNACETAMHSTRDALMGVAQALIREEIPAVIAMQFLVSETVALMFTRRLYEFLFRGDPLEKVVTETRVGLDINTDGDRISWGIPVLFMRARDGFLWRPFEVQRRSGLDSLITADLKAGVYRTRAQAVTTEDILLNKVNRQWSVDVLARSIPNAERRIDFVFNRRSDGAALDGKAIIDIFDDCDNSFLLLGAAGSGKTIALCELLQTLIQRAGVQRQQPYPVVLRLATWRPLPAQTLKSWIEAQLQTQYGLGQTHIDEIEPRGLILLLDGLDEVCAEHRSSCVKAINDHCGREGWINIVVTCRASDYSDLESRQQGLTIPRDQIITVAPLDSARIEAFLNRLDSVGVKVGHLHSLLEHERTPLMTDVILQTYEGKPGKHLQDLGVADVWERYVARKFEDDRFRRESAGEGVPYSPAMTKKWLSWVARQLHSQTEDQHRLFVEELQPDWLPGGKRILSYGLTFAALLAAAYLFTLFAFRAAVPVLYGQEGVHDYLGDYSKISVPLGALWIVLLIWVFARRSPTYVGPIAVGILSGVVFGTMIWVPYRNVPALPLAGGAVAGIIATILVRAVIGVLGFCDKQIVCVKRRKWDWGKAGAGLVIGGGLRAHHRLHQRHGESGLFRWSLPGLFFAALQKALSFDTVRPWNWGFPGLLSMSLFFMLVLGLGWGEVVLRDEVAVPNKGIIDSGKNGLTVAACGIIAGLVFSLTIGVPCYFGIGVQASQGSCVRGELTSLLSGVGFGFGYGAILGLVFSMILGGFAWMRHYVVRLLLYFDGRQIRWEFESFLKYAAKLHLLRRVGGGFEFIDQQAAGLLRSRRSRCPCN